MQYCKPDTGDPDTAGDPVESLPTLAKLPASKKMTEMEIMPIYQQPWFWTGVFGIVGSLGGSLGGILIRELLASKAQLRLERLKLHEADILKAYRGLYSFISSAYCLYPPNDPDRDFQDLMRTYFRDVKPNKILFNADIRSSLQILESQYDCLRDPGLIPEKPFDEFFSKDLCEILNDLETLVEKLADRIYQL